MNETIWREAAEEVRKISDAVKAFQAKHPGALTKISQIKTEGDFEYIFEVDLDKIN